MSALRNIEQWAANRRRTKKAGAGPVTTQNLGTAIVVGGDRFRGLMDDTMATSQWLPHGVHMIEVDPGTNVIAVRNWEEARWQHRPDADEGDGNFDATVRPTNRDVQIATQHHVMEMSLGKRAQRRAKALLNADLRRSDEQGFARAFGNNMARTVVRADPASADDSLNAFTGLHLLAQANGRTFSLAQNVGGVQVAQAFDPDELFWSALELLPEAMRSKRLRWYGNDRLWTQWGRWLANGGTTERMRDDLAQEALIEGRIRGPLGRTGLSIPDWPADQGPAGTPDSVVDDGDGTLTARVNIVLPDANDYTGRRVRITYEPSGAFEDLTVVRNAGQNEIESVGALGQAAISVVAADYTVDVIDESSIMLADPFGILVPIENQIEVYRDFDVRGLTFDTIAHVWLDTRLLRPDAVVFVDGFFLPRRA